MTAIAVEQIQQREGHTMRRSNTFYLGFVTGFMVLAVILSATAQDAAHAGASSVLQEGTAVLQQDALSVNSHKIHFPCLPGILFFFNLKKQKKKRNPACLAIFSILATSIALL